MKTVILGAGGHAKVIIDLLEHLLDAEAAKNIELLDDNLAEGSLICGKQVKGKISKCIDYPANTQFIIGVGNNKIRKKIAGTYDLPYITLIHPSAVIGKDVRIGKGTVVMANAVINCESEIGEHCIVNTAATVDHECEIQNFVHISPGAHLGGCVKVGSGSWIGIGSSIKNGLSICIDVVVGAGGVVIKNIGTSGIYTGIPVRKVRK